MGLTIYGVPASRTFRVLWMAEELGIPYEHARIGTDGSGVGTPEYRRINPNARIPAIRDDDFTMWESLAINLYLAKRYDNGLEPRGLHEEARALQWSFWAATEIDQPIVDWARHTMMLPEAERNAVTAAKAIEQLQRPFAVLDAELNGKTFLLGQRFSVADLNVAATMYRCLWMDLGARPNIVRWLKACYDRPGAKKARKLREG